MATCSRFVSAARHMSTAGASAGKLVKVYGLGGRYAHALYSAACKQNKLVEVDQELTSLEGLLARSDTLSSFVHNPAVRKQDKLNILQELVKENKMCDLTGNFVGLLTENNRLNKMKDVLSAWSQIMSSHKGEVVCNIKTAKPLDASQQKQLQDALQGFIAKNETLKIHTSIDPSLLGGMVVELGDKYIDMSVSTKVKKMKELIQEVA